MNDENDIADDDAVDAPLPPTIVITFGPAININIDPRIHVINLFGAAELLRYNAESILNDQKVAKMQEAYDRQQLIRGLQG